MSDSFTLCCRRRGLGRLQTFSGKRTTFFLSTGLLRSQPFHHSMLFPWYHGRLIIKNKCCPTPTPTASLGGCFLTISCLVWEESHRPSQQPPSLHSGSFQSEGGCQGNHRYQSPTIPLNPGLIYIERNFHSGAQQILTFYNLLKLWWLTSSLKGLVFLCGS